MATISPAVGTLTPDAIVGQPCTYTFTLTPIDPSLTISDITMTGAPTDPGLTFTPGPNPPQGGSISGTLAGTPTLVATYSSITINVIISNSGGSGPFSYGPYTLNVTPAGNAYTTASPPPGSTLPDGTQNVPLSNAVQIEVDGTTVAITVNTMSQSGVTDPGITLTTSRPVDFQNLIGTFTGTPTIITTYTDIYVSGTVTVPGSGTFNYSWGPYTWSIVAENANNYVQIQFIPDPLPSGTQGVPYSNPQVLVAVTSGTFDGPPTMTGLPPGLTITTPVFVGFNYEFTITGTPTTAGTYNSIFVTGQLVSSQSGRTLTYDVGPYTIVINPLCIVTNTEILMANHTTRLIQHIKRGDLVSSNLSKTQIHRVARVLSTKLNPETNLEMCVVHPNSISINQPAKKLLIAPSHPIVDVHNQVRRAARYFPTVEILSDRVKNLLPPTNNQEYVLWDLQFETIGSYVANNLVIQSRHPQSFITPLPKELYFTDSLFSPNTTNDHDPAFEYPLMNNYDI